MRRHQSSFGHGMGTGAGLGCGCLLMLVLVVVAIGGLVAYGRKQMHDQRPSSVAIIVAAEWRIGKTPLKPFLRETGESEKANLNITVTIRNTTTKQKIDYRRTTATVEDEHGNCYRPVVFGLHEVCGAIDDASISPGETITDVYIFEPPIKQAHKLTFVIGGDAVGQQRPLRATITIPND